MERARDPRRVGRHSCTMSVLLAWPPVRTRCFVTHAVPLQTGMQPFPGYRLLQVIGRGGFAEVWEAKRTDDATVALKFMPCSDNLAAAKEIRAIESIRRLDHPNLVQIE